MFNFLCGFRLFIPFRKVLPGLESGRLWCEMRLWDYVFANELCGADGIRGLGLISKVFSDDMW